MSNLKRQADETKVPNVINGNNTEEFIEDKFPVYIRYNMILDCDVIRVDKEKNSLRHMIKNKEMLGLDTKLIFKINDIDVTDKYDIYWKILNCGDRAKELHMVRGQVVLGILTKVEYADFVGDHIVECYAVKNGVVVARDIIHVNVRREF
jgi:hypothetical protein